MPGAVVDKHSSGHLTRPLHSLNGVGIYVGVPLCGRARGRGASALRL